MTRIRLILLAAMAMCVFASVGAASASAEAPRWLVNGERFDCEKLGTGHKYNTLLECLGGPGSTSGEWERSTLSSVNGVLNSDQGVLGLAEKRPSTGNFRLVTSAVTIECTAVEAHLVLVGGKPGKNHEIINFTGCSVHNKTQTECMVRSPNKGLNSGEIETEAKSELVFLQNIETGKVGVLFEPESGTTFVRLVLEGTNCPIFTSGEQEVKGSVAAEIETVEGMETSGNLKFPSPPITQAWQWVKNGELKEVTPALQVFGFVTAEQIGEALVMLSGGQSFGVLR